MKLKLKEKCKGRDISEFKDIWFNGGSSDKAITDFLTQDEERDFRNAFSQWLDMHVLSLMNSVVEYILKKSYEDTDAPFSYDDIINMRTLDLECLKDVILDEYEELDIEEVNKEFNRKIKKKEDFKVFLNSLDEDELKQFAVEKCNIDLDDHMIDNEPYQWFLVSGWFAAWCEENDEIIIPEHNYWGRKCYGQSIALDHKTHKAFYDYYDLGEKR